MTISQRKLSRNAKPIVSWYGTPEFRGENFRGWLENCGIRECFLPQKFSVIRYTSTIVLLS